MIETKVVTPIDDLAELVNQINEASWDDANEMCLYDVESLRKYLNLSDTLFITCHSVHAGKRTLLGFASSRFQLKPYENERWLYIDELDVCADQRRKGAGAAMMRKLFSLAEKNNCVEVWLGTEIDNVAAIGLYRSLKPDDEAEVVGYTYTLAGNKMSQTHP